MLAVCAREEGPRAKLGNHKKELRSGWEGRDPEIRATRKRRKGWKGVRVAEKHTSTRAFTR